MLPGRCAAADSPLSPEDFYAQYGPGTVKPSGHSVAVEWDFVDYSATRGEFVGLHGL